MILIIMKNEDRVRQAMKAYPDKFVDDVVGLMNRLGDEKHLTDESIGLEKDDGGVIVEPFEKNGVAITFDEPDWGRRPEIGTCGCVTWIDDEGAEEKTLVCVGPRESQFACALSEDGAVFNDPVFDAVLEQLRVKLGKERDVDFDAAAAIVKIAELLPKMNDTEIKAILNLVEKRARAR